jgi:myo-inositol 2-dehydrogenase/D-chiro-inositol 1-dehydrogenase
MSEVKTGFIGAGGNARGHMTRLSAVDEARIVAICDVSEDAAQSAADEFGGSVYTDHHDMLDEVEMDALYISVPPFAHTDAELLPRKRPASLRREARGARHR